MRGRHRIAASALRFGAPETAREGVEELGRRGVVGSDLAVRLGDVVGMRNVLIHDYLAVDPSRVFVAIQDLGPLKQFVAQVSDWMRGLDL